MSRTIDPVRAAPTVSDVAPTRPTVDPTRTSLEERVVAELLATIGRLRCLTAERLMHHGVSLANLHLLQLLDGHGELTMSRVADALAVSMSNATGLIDRMAERGLVERHRDLTDRRVVHVHITAAGRRVLADSDAIREGPLRSVVTRLDDDQLRRLADAAADIHRAADEEVGVRLRPVSGGGACPAHPRLDPTSVDQALVADTASTPAMRPPRAAAQPSQRSNPTR